MAPRQADTVVQTAEHDFPSPQCAVKPSQEDTDKHVIDSALSCNARFWQEETPLQIGFHFPSNLAL